MSWTSAYRLALCLLPSVLRRKHGPAMEALFARELERAGARGWRYRALAGITGIWDVMRRGAYEQLRPGRGDGADLAPPPASQLTTSQLTTSQLLRRHASSFAIVFVPLTATLLALFVRRQLLDLGARGAPAGTIAQALILAVPFTAAMTIPMAVLIAVQSEFARLRADGTLAAARRERYGVRRLVMPVLAAATGVAALAFVEIAEIVPRANLRLQAVLMGSPQAPSGRTMTIGELRDAEQAVAPSTTPVALASAAIYRIEIQKKLAIPTACLVMALAGVAIALRVPRGAGLVMCAVFAAYYVLIITGESLAVRLVVSPLVAMWAANALVLAAALLALWSRRAPLGPSDRGAVVIGG
jgi:lipopolysaccharide export LptBFGC system permease protein LptF